MDPSLAAVVATRPLCAAVMANQALFLVHIAALTKASFYDTVAERNTGNTVAIALRNTEERTQPSPLEKARRAPQCRPPYR
jgi:hypothetical protein